MNEEFYNKSNDEIAPELEVRLLAMLQGEASDFERDYLEQLIAAQPEVAAAFAELLELHGTLVEVGTGELVSAEHEWKLPAARRDKLLQVFAGAAAVDDSLQPVFVPIQEQRKWTTLPRSFSSFASVVTVVCLIGIFCAMLFPSVQMARRATRSVAPMMSLGSTMQDGYPATLDSDELARAQAESASVRSLAEGRSNPSIAPMESALESVKSQLQDTLQDGMPATRYLDDSLQSLPTPATAQPSLPMLGKSSTRARDSAGAPAVRDRAIAGHDKGMAGNASNPGDGLGGLGGMGSEGASIMGGRELRRKAGNASGVELTLDVEAAEKLRTDTIQLGEAVKQSQQGLAITRELQQQSGGYRKEMVSPLEGLTAGLALTPSPSGEGFESALKRSAGAEVAAGQPFDGQNLREDLDEENRNRALSRPTAEPRQVAAQELEELSAANASFSTFSLHVSDVSFKLAWAALSQGQWPDASKIRIEEFVNAFDYHDPLPTNTEKVACQLEQARHPFLMQRNVLRVSMRTAATGRNSSTPLRLTLVLDNSGSMERVDRRQTLRRAFETLMQQLKPADQITLISFANQPRLLADRIRGDQAKQLLQIIETLPSEGGTNIEAALRLAMEKATEQVEPGAQHRIVLLTDGAVNLGDANPDNLSSIVANMRDAGIAFDAAGVSARGLNDEVLEALSRQGDGRYYLLDDAEDTNSGFAEQLAGALRPSAKNVKVQVEFNPQRVGQYKLLGFEKHRLQTEDFRNDQVDAAEMAAAEAGVAIYQFEAKPDGTGDIGSVSVRFRDVTTGHMVERTWPIPYESHPPRLEKASASLRIATAAALLASKLKGEPLGASVSVQNLAEWIAELPAANRAQLRVQQLQSMLAIARQIESNRQ